MMPMDVSKPEEQLDSLHPFFSFYILFILLVESYGPVNHKKHVAGGSSYGLNFKSVNIFIF